MAHAGVNDLVRKQQWVSRGWRRRVIRQRKKECSAVTLRQWTAAITRSGSSHILRKILWVWSEAFITLDILLVIIYWLGHWCQRANAKGSDAHSPSGVIVNAEKVKRSVYFCGWHKDGHPACKTSHKTPYFTTELANPGLPLREKMAVKMVCTLHIYVCLLVTLWWNWLSCTTSLSVTDYWKRNINITSCTWRHKSPSRPLTLSLLKFSILLPCDATCHPWVHPIAVHRSIWCALFPLVGGLW